MTILTGGPHLYIDQVPAEPRRIGFEDAMDNTGPDPRRHSQLWGRDERAAYYAGHIRGTLARIQQERTTPAPRPIHVEPWEMTA